MRAARCNFIRRRRGVILVATISVLLLLGAIVLVMARSSRVEAIASANRLSSEQANSIELGAEQYVLAAVDQCGGDAVGVLQTPAEQVQLGAGYFWILQTYYDNDNTYAFGITDENSKLNLNVASDNALMTLPGMRQDVADSIVTWRGGGGATSGQGGDSSYYQSLPRPYNVKTGPFESIDELYLLKDVDDSLLWGVDLDHNGMIDNNETAVGGNLSTAYNAANDTARGIMPFLTVWGSEPSTTTGGKPRINIANSEPDQPPLQELLEQKINPGRAIQIMAVRRAVVTSQPPFRNVFDFAGRVNMTSTELAAVQNDLTATPAKVLPGLINVNTASAQVLMSLPGISQQDAENIITQRVANTTTGTETTGATNRTKCAWMMDVIKPAPKLAAIGSLITGRSFYYSADIVAVSGEGRGYKRVRIIVDARNSPPRIVFRKDLTYLGWPLSPDILTALRTGQPLPAASGYGTGGANGLGS